jgi:hypothetical protein
MFQIRRSLTTLTVNPTTKVAKLLLSNPPVNTLTLPLLTKLHADLTGLQTADIKGLLFGSSKAVFASDKERTECRIGSEVPGSPA